MKHSAKADGRPSMQFYPDAWFKDIGVRMSSLAARGLWADMLFLMWDSPERGVLRKQNGSKVESKDLAKICGSSEAEIDALLTELDGHGVFSKTTHDGTIYSRRMVRDEAFRKKRADAGRLGGMAGKEFGKLGGRPTKIQPKPKQITPPPTPSSSSSPSSSPTPLKETAKETRSVSA